jgi:hypothetical protein
MLRLVIEERPPRTDYDPILTTRTDDDQHAWSGYLSQPPPSGSEVCIKTHAPAPGPLLGARRSTQSSYTARHLFLLVYQRPKPLTHAKASASRCLRNQVRPSSPARPPPDPDHDNSEAVRTPPPVLRYTGASLQFAVPNDNKLSPLAQYGRSLSYTSNAIATHAAEGAYKADLTPPDPPNDDPGLLELESSTSPPTPQTQSPN